ncbi:MAG: hypothetical protein ACKPBG_01655, partial [Actinomycetota bacterium]
ATRRAPAKRRKKKQASRVPAIFLAGLIAGVGGVLLVRATEDTYESPGTVAVDGSEAPSSSDDSSAPGGTDASGGGSPGPATDPSNLGKPVKIFSDTLGDVSFDPVIEDWTSTDPPQVPTITAEVRPTWVVNGRIDLSLPDGFYWGVPVSVFDEEQRGINFDIRQAFIGDACRQRFGNDADACLNDIGVTPSDGPQLYPGFLEELLFVSMAITPDRNTAVVPATYWNLMNGGLPALVDVPSDSGDQQQAFLVGSPFLVTIVDGVIIAVEGIWVP